MLWVPAIEQLIREMFWPERQIDVARYHQLTWIAAERDRAPHLVRTSDAVRERPLRLKFHRRHALPDELMFARTETNKILILLGIEKINFREDVKGIFGFLGQGCREPRSRP